MAEPIREVTNLSKIKVHVLRVSVFICVTTVAAQAQSFRVQCPTSTITHPTAANNNSEPAYNGHHLAHERGRVSDADAET